MRDVQETGKNNSNKNISVYRIIKVGNTTGYYIASCLKENNLRSNEIIKG